jgi:hypothetical protein
MGFLLGFVIGGAVVWFFKHHIILAAIWAAERIKDGLTDK